MDNTQLATISYDNNMASSSSPQFLCPDDLCDKASTSPSPSPPFENSDGTITLTQGSSAITVHSKPAKKRKSWGQALPEPKTALPPRKRAKTDDEKEQRRIERIKRNRAAAHNSRERKRQETETLAVALARANAELEAYRSLHGPLPSHIVLPEVTLDNGETPTDPIDNDADPSPATPPQDVIKQEMTDDTFLPTPPAFEYLDAKATTLNLDPTQHSAAMLCDLPCRSSSSLVRPQASMTSTSPTSWLATLFLHLTMLQLQTCYKTILLAIWSLSPSRMARLMRASTSRSTSASTNSSTTTVPLLLRSMAMARFNAATGHSTGQRGAHKALQRSLVGNEVSRTTVESAVAGVRVDSVLQQRKEFGKDQFRDQGHSDGKRDSDESI